MIRFIKKLLFLLFLGGIVLTGTTNYDSFKGHVKSLIEDFFTLNKISDFVRVTSNGELINDKEVDLLKNSGITGENYSFDITYYPYYEMLSPDEQILYKQIYANINELSTTFVPNVTLKTDAVNKIIEAIFNDHPELFWLNTNYSYKYTKNGNCVQIILSFNETIDNFEVSKNLFESEAQKIIDKTENLRTNYEKEKYVHDILIEQIDYDTNASMNQSAFSALVNKKTVCAGYARAFQYIMIKLGIPTYYVTGSAGEEHAWNIVYLSDGYYNVDLTWDDTNSSYVYFNVNDSILLNTHKRNGLSINLPSCNAMAYSNLEVKKEEDNYNNYEYYWKKSNDGNENIIDELSFDY